MSQNELIFHGAHLLVWIGPQAAICCYCCCLGLLQDEMTCLSMDFFGNSSACESSELSTAWKHLKKCPHLHNDSGFRLPLKPVGSLSAAVRRSRQGTQSSWPLSKASCDL